MRNWMIVIGIAGVAAVGCGGGSKGAAAPLAPVGAQIVKVEAGQVPQVVDLYGTVDAERTAAVSSRVMATVTAVLVQPGDTVRQGQVLVEIDPATARGQEGQAKGALAQAEAALALAERNLERFKALAAKGAASQLELDMATMQYRQAKGAVAQGEGAVEATSSIARESKVVAPFAGRVTAKLAEVGDLAAPGRPLVMVESATGRRLVLAVPETVLAGSGLKVGAPVAVRLDSRPGQVMDGRVSEVYPGADPISHAFTVKVAIEGEVAAGLSGHAAITVGTREAVGVPRAALQRMGGLDLVVVRDVNGLSQSRAVTVGGELPDGRVEVLSGLSAGEDVAVGLAQVPPDGTPLEARS
jgi:membrane fusion protein, multidrug efflux system